MFENNLDRAQTNSVETIGEYNNIVPICSWSAWWTKEEGRGEGGRKSSVDAENFMKAYSSCVDKIFAHNSPPMNEYITEKILIK